MPAEESINFTYMYWFYLENWQTCFDEGKVQKSKLLTILSKKSMNAGENRVG